MIDKGVGSGDKKGVHQFSGALRLGIIIGIRWKMKKKIMTNFSLF